MRVGLSAQGYPFPAPTGIAEYELRKPGAKRLLSVSGRLGPFGSKVLELDGQLPVTDRLSIGAGYGMVSDRNHTGGAAEFRTAALMARRQPVDGVEIMPFWSRVGIADEELPPLLLTAGDFLPPRLERVKRIGQKWAANDGETITAGLATTVKSGGWTLKAGAFRSILDLDPVSYTHLTLPTNREV